MSAAATDQGQVDEGLADERTALAWQRTSLSLVAGAGVVARLGWSDLGPAGSLPLLASCLLAVWVFVESRRRYDDDSGARGRVRPRGGRAPLALALSVALLAGTELARLALA
ncbi:DUF202 domain-containing protein [Nocardioides solisilvae]|uniref:DUF202 domain-containing protein n=1 Tax=Nocardioides solisilvae TaxID=1542435 RepID=UPI000D74A7E6|nr:DUF202 domain-containing protein [Nocardioides solisilvae]